MFALVHRAVSRSAFAGASFAILAFAAATPAAALDAATLFGKYIALAAHSGYVITHGAIEDGGNGNFVVRDIEISGKELKAPGRIAQLRVGGARETADNSFIAETFEASGISYLVEEEDTGRIEVAIDAIEATGVYYADPANIDAPLTMFARSTTSIGVFTINRNGKVALRADGAEAVSETLAGGSIHASTIDFGRAVIHLANIADEETLATLKREGVEELVLTGRIAGKWDPAAGIMELEEYALDAPAFGKLRLRLMIDGYTGDFAREMRRSAPPATGAEALESDMMKQAMSRLRLVGGVITYEDKSLAGRALDFQAAAVGASRQDIIDMAFGFTLAGTQVLNNPGFSLGLAQAVRTFLSEPRSFSVRLAPGSPVALGEIFSSALVDPASLINSLGVDIKAND